MVYMPGMPWWMRDFNSWLRVTGRMTLDEAWEERDSEQDRRNEERRKSWEIKLTCMVR